MDDNEASLGFRFLLALKLLRQCAAWTETEIDRSLGEALLRNILNVLRNMMQPQPNPSHSRALVRAQLQARKSPQPVQLDRPTVQLDRPNLLSSDDDIRLSEKRETLQQLSREVQRLEAVGRTTEAQEAISTGCAALDACLPRRGYVPGSVIEYLRSSPACGASYLALAAAASAMRASDGFLVIASTKHEIYPAALLSHGIALDKTIFIRPESQADLIWSVDQSLRTPAVIAVLAEFELLDDRAARRLQLAAEHGRGLGFLLRNTAARRHPSWAEVQWVVKGVAPPASSSNALGNRQLDVQLARVRGGQAGATLRLQIQASTGEITTRADYKLKQTPATTPHDVRERNRHEQNRTQAGAVHLATELASAARASRRTEAG